MSFRQQGFVDFCIKLRAALILFIVVYIYQFFVSLNLNMRQLNCKKNLNVLFIQR